MRDNFKPVETAEEYRALAETCFRQAGATLHPETARILRRMGEDYIAKADRIASADRFASKLRAD